MCEHLHTQALLPLVSASGTSTPRGSETEGGSGWLVGIAFPENVRHMCHELKPESGLGGH